MAGYSKLFSGIVTSSIWCEDDKTFKTFIAMLALTDASGHVDGSIPGFARLVGCTIPEMEHAIERLMAPDPYSRTPDHDGRRIEADSGGWRILNYAAYREKGQAKDGSRAEYMRRYRAGLGGSWPSPKQRNEIMSKFGWKCSKCESKDDLQLDHITPRSRGGTDDESNLQVLCKSCNLTKRGHDGNTRGNVTRVTHRNNLTSHDTAPASASASAYLSVGRNQEVGTEGKGFDVPDLGVSA